MYSRYGTLQRKHYVERLLKVLFDRTGSNPVPTYLVNPNTSSVDEGAAVVFTVTTTNVADGTVLYWTNSGTTVAADFSDSANSGTVTINSDTGTISRTLLLDAIASETETVILELRTDSVSGPVVATSGTVTVIDKTAVYAVAESTASVNEGSSVTFTVTTTNVANGTTLYWTTSGTATAADFTDNLTSGSFTVTSGTATITRTIQSDVTTEGPETFTLSIRTGSIAGTVVATSGTVTINDTSLSPAGGSVNDRAIILAGDTTYSEVSSATADLSGNIYVLMTYRDSLSKVPIYQYGGVTGGVVSRTIWGFLPIQTTVACAIIKYTSSGIPVWVSSITNIVGGTTSRGAVGRAVEVDVSGNVYVCHTAMGDQNGNITYRSYTTGGGSGTDISSISTGRVTNISGSASTGDVEDVYLAIYNSSGTFQRTAGMVTPFGGNATDFNATGVGMKKDSNNNCYVFSGFKNVDTYRVFRNFSDITVSGWINFIDWRDAQDGDGNKSHIVKINSNCQIQWIARVKQSLNIGSHISPYGIDTTSDGNSTSICVSSRGAGLKVEDVSGVSLSGGVPFVFYKKPPKDIEPIGGTVSEAYIVNFDVSGISRWIGRINGTGGNAVPSDVGIDISGNTYVCGTYTISTPMVSSFSGFTVAANLSLTINLSSYGTLSRPGTGPSGFIAKYNASGVVQCATSIQGGTGTNCVLTSVTSDASGFVYVTATTNNVVSNSVRVNNFGSAAGNGTAITETLYGTTESKQANDVFLIEYNPSLAVQWVTKVESGTGGTGEDWSYFTTKDPVSNVLYMGGYFVTNNTSPLVFYNASGVNGTTIQYTQYASLSGGAGSATSISNGFLVRYNI